MSRNVAAADYIRGVMESIVLRRQKYHADATNRLFDALIATLGNIETFVLRYNTPIAESVNSSVVTHPDDDKKFGVKVQEQLRLIEKEQIRLRPTNLWAEFTTLIAGAIRLFVLVSDAIDRHLDHIRERREERARAAANGDLMDDSDSDQG